MGNDSLSSEEEKITTNKNANILQRERGRIKKGRGGRERHHQEGEGGSSHSTARNAQKRKELVQEKEFPCPIVVSSWSCSGGEKLYPTRGGCVGEVNHPFSSLSRAKSLPRLKISTNNEQPKIKPSCFVEA